MSICRAKGLKAYGVTSYSTIYTHTHTQTSGFSTLLKINHLHGEISTITTIPIPDIHMSNTDKNKNTSIIIRQSNVS